MSWFMEIDNVFALGRYLAWDLGWSGRAIQCYYEEPWLCEIEWRKYEAIKRREVEQQRLASGDQ